MSGYHPGFGAVRDTEIAEHRAAMLDAGYTECEGCAEWRRGVCEGCRLPGDSFLPHSGYLSPEDAVRFPRTMRLLALVDAQSALSALQLSRGFYGRVDALDAQRALGRAIDALMFSSLDDTEVWL